MIFKNTFKFYIAFFVLFLSITPVKAQDKETPWTFMLGVSALDVGTGNDLRSVVKDYLDLSSTDIFPSIKTKISRHVFAGLSLGLEGHFNFINEEQLTHIDTFGAKRKVAFGGDLALDYQFFTNFFINPYVSLGGGYSIFGEDQNITGNAGLGFNLWFSRHVGFNFQTSYKTTSFLGNTFESVGSPTYFHHSLGFILRLGPKDTDLDGVPDKDDMCPKEKGSKRAKGCPDADKDGVADIEDECPKEKGSRRTKGCPDADKDGVADKDDACPKEKGTKKTNGCPDADKDGIADKDDACPKEKGSEENNGCPDTDEDGVIDKEDECPKQAGSKENRGCPDTDGDGVIDKEDECPEQAGPKENNGCPDTSDVERTDEKVLTAEDVARFSEKNYFEVSSSVISESGAALLDGLADILKNSLPEQRILIKGHTDATGTRVFNARLSLLRAYNVKKYLVEKGVEANKIFLRGYGDKVSTQEGEETKTARSQNRRVEIIAYSSVENYEIPPGLSILHEVLPDETLEEIANNYDISVETLKLINGLTEEPEVGKLLVVEYMPTIQGSLEEIKNSYRKSANRYRKHKVRRNDTLFSLAKKYNTTVQELMRINGLKDNKIKLGTILKIK